MNRSLSVSRTWVLALGLCAAALAASAQQLGDLEKKAGLSDADRAKRDADKVFQWIKFNADKAPAKAAPAPAPVKPAAPVAKAPARPDAERTAAAKGDAAAHKAEPAPAPEAVRQAAAPAEEPVQVAAVSPKLNPPPPAAVAPEPEPEVALQLLNKVEPEIPRQLLNTLRSGVVVVKFTVEANGEVKEAEATKSSHRKLAAVAVDAVKQWRFAPLPKPREVSVEIGFQAE